MISETPAGQAEDGDENGEKVGGAASEYAPSSNVGVEAEAGDFDVNVPDEFVDGLHEEFEEKTERSGLPRPVQPSLKEIEEHQIAHVPYRSWCVHCVRGKAHATAHPRSAGEKLPDRRQTVALDYFFLGKREESSMPILGVVEEATFKMFFHYSSLQRFGSSIQSGSFDKGYKGLGSAIWCVEE